MDDPVVLTPSQMITSSKLARNLSSCLDRIKEKGPLFILREGELEAVLLSLEDYRKLLGGKMGE